MNSLEREFKAITELQSRGLDFGLVPNQSSDFSMNERSIRFYRKGTHDLSDVGHDLLIGEFFEILVNLAIQISEIHNNGYVHRDIKPGNIMISQKSSGKAFAGIVDFGMTLKINRKQDEEELQEELRILAIIRNLRNLNALVLAKIGMVSHLLHFICCEEASHQCRQK